MPSPLLFLAAPSVLVFILLVWHLDQNLGHKKTGIYFGLLFLYGVIRANWLVHITKDDLGSAFPYLINLPVLKIGGASLQELIGWSVAVTLAWLIADRLLLRLRITPGPYRVSALAAVILCAVCLAVETAAIESGWWQWTLLQYPKPFFGKVPLVGLLDWGFVAFDFLLAFLVFSVPSSWKARIPALALFALHFRFHSELGKLPEPLLVTPNDLAHAAIFAFVLAVAVDEKSSSALPVPEKERLRVLPLIGGVIVALATALSCIYAAGNTKTAFACIPLLVLVIAAYAFPWPAKAVSPPVAPQKSKPAKNPARKVAAKTEEQDWRVFWIRLGIAVSVFCLVCALRIPFNRKSAAFVSHLQSANSMMNAGQMTAAEAEIRKAIEIRPEHSGGHMMLAQVLIVQKRIREARSELQQALKVKPTDLSAMILMSIVEIRLGNLAEAKSIAQNGQRIYPDHSEFQYLLALSDSGGPSSTISPAVRKVLDQVKTQQNARAAVMLVAYNLEDTAVMSELRNVRSERDTNRQ